MGQIKAKVFTDKIDVLANRAKERAMLEDYRNLKEDFEKSQREIEDLRGQLREAKTGQEKNQVREIIGRNEKQFQSTQLVEKGLKLFLDKDYDTAIATLKDALEMDQDNAGAYGMLGIAYWAQGKDTLAIGYLSKAIERKPKIIQAYLFRGIIYRDRQQWIYPVAETIPLIGLIVGLILGWRISR